MNVYAWTVCVHVWDFEGGGCEQPIAGTAVASHGGMEAGRFISSRQTPELLPLTNNSTRGTSGSNKNHYTKFACVRRLHVCVNVCVFLNCFVSSEFIFCRGSTPCAYDPHTQQILLCLPSSKGRGDTAVTSKRKA